MFTRRGNFIPGWLTERIRLLGKSYGVTFAVAIENFEDRLIKIRSGFVQQNPNETEECLYHYAYATWEPTFPIEHKFKPVKLNSSDYCGRLGGIDFEIVFPPYLYDGSEAVDELFEDFEREPWWAEEVRAREADWQEYIRGEEENNVELSKPSETSP